jgi:thymidylate kinase
MSGLLIVFSGIDGAGKSTQIKKLQDQLHAAGKRTVYLWSRGGYTNGFLALKALLRRLGHGNVIPQPGHSEARTNVLGRPLVRRIWLTIAMLDLLYLYALCIRYWRRINRTVVCDRYLYDTLVDFRLNFPQERFERWLLWRMLVALTPKPDVAVLLLIPVEESLLRSQQKNVPFPDSREVLTQRLEAYQQFADQEKWLVLDGMEPIESVATRIWHSVCALQPTSQLT